MQFTRASNVVRAAARMKTLAALARARGVHEDLEHIGEEEPLLASSTPLGLSADGPHASSDAAAEDAANGEAGLVTSSGRCLLPSASRNSSMLSAAPCDSVVRLSSIANSLAEGRPGRNSILHGSIHGDSPLGAGVPWYRRDAIAVKEMLFSSWLSLMLIAAPLGVVSALHEWGAVPTFMLNFLALVPLALLLGDITEDLAVRFGDTVGGLLNATFGNVVEMILSIAALQKGLYSVVSTSLLGSILSNLLLVLGCCFLFGGIKYHTQTFNAVANQATSSLLFLSCIGITLPTAARFMWDDATDAGGAAGRDEFVLSVSRGAAIILLATYVCYLVFQLHTHSDIFSGDGDDAEPVMTLPGALLCLTAITATVAVCSEYLTGSLEEFCGQTGLGKPFVGLIVLPIAGNACEHLTAIIVAMKNKMDLALGVAVGSSIQIAIFAIPFVVLVGWAIGHPFSLDFDPFAVLILTVSVVHANFVTSDARSHWLMGVQLIATYLLIGLAFLYK